MLALVRSGGCGGHPQLLHLAQRVGVGPALRYLALLKALDGDTRYLHPIARSGAEGLRLALVGAARRPAHHHLVPFGYKVLGGRLEVREGLAIAHSETLGGLKAHYVREGWGVAHVLLGVGLL